MPCPELQIYIPFSSRQDAPNDRFPTTSLGDLGTRMAGLFDLVTTDDLCAKLDHDYRRVKAAPADVFAAFDFIVTAWHLLEWKHPGSDGKAQRDVLWQQYPILALCEHLCVSGKHYDPTNPKLKAVQGSFRKSAWERGAWAPGVWAKGTWQDELFIDLSGSATAAFGERITMDRLADLVMEFWRGPGGCPKESHVSGSAM